MDKIEAKKIVNECAGSPSELKQRLRRINIRYTKINRGFNTYYILRGKNIGKVEVKL